MAKKKQNGDKAKSRPAKSAKARKTPQDIFDFWSGKNMREAKPISIEIDRPEDGLEEK